MEITDLPDLPDLIIAAVSLKDIVQARLPLQKKGNVYWARCPFHSEQTPSFFIDDRAGYYHCFGCGASGTVIDFVGKTENVDYATALKTLASAIGIN